MCVRVCSFFDHRRADHFGGKFMTHSGALASVLVAVAMWQAIAYHLYRKKIFVVV